MEIRTGNNYDEIWKVDENWLNDKISNGYEIYLVDDPSKIYYENNHATFYQRELDYLLKTKQFTYTQINNNLWKINK